MVRIASLAAAVAIGAGIPLAGCAMHDGMHGHSHGPVRIATASVYNVQRDQVRIRFEAPPLVAGEMALLRLHVAYDADAPVRGAVATATIRTEGDHSVHEETPVTPAVYVFVEQEMPGDYVLGHLFEAAGSYSVNVGVTLTASGSSPVQINSVLQVAEASSGQHDTHPSSLLVLAGVGMALMMLLGMTVF